MGLYDDLLAWSSDQPSWQRDALRRLVTVGDLGEDDLTDLTQLALGASGVSGAPLAAAHLPTHVGGSEDVRLSAVVVGENLNALPPEARLDFELQGLTIVYGGNGSGKSGYVRVLKSVCRARGAPERVLPNMLRSDSSEPGATVEYVVAGVPRRHAWSPASTPPQDLASVTVFDRACAAVYVNSESEVAYRPLGLDLIDRLATAAQDIRRRLELMRAQSDSHAPGPPALLSATEAVRSIWPPSGELSVREVRRKAGWSAKGAETLEGLNRALAAPNPSEAIAGLSARRAALLRAVKVCESGGLARRDAQSLPLAMTRLDEANAAMAGAHGADLERSGIAGVGGPLWRALWAAAERFSSQTAYPAHTFPNTEPGARCVLCGQELSAGARARFQGLRRLVEEELSAIAEAAGREVVEIRQRLVDFIAAGGIRERIPELQGIDPEASNRVGAHVEIALERAREALGEPATEGQQPITEAEDPSGWLKSRVLPLENEITNLQRANVAEELEKMSVERLELQGRLWVAENADSIVAEGVRLKSRRAINAALATCDTARITAEGNQLTVKYVTDALRADFARELKRLNPSRVPVRIVQRGSYGSTYHRLQVANTTTFNAKVSEVVSDGEFRGLALANFFAETLSSSTCSAVVVDDPVTSLDHRFRARVAERLADEASRRQVIVFTHDLVFLQDLVGAAERTGVAVGFRRLALTRTHVGVPQADPPWDGMKVGQRIEAQQLSLNKLRKMFDDGDLDKYETGVERWYSLQRSTWERAVEEVLLVDAVNRYRSSIKTNNLISERVWMIDEEDVRDVEAAMTKCSSWTEAHDEPAAADRPPPGPDEMRDDLEMLRAWVARLKAKRK